MRPSAPELIAAALEWFDAAGVVLPDGPSRPEFWRAWIGAGRHADMEWLVRTAELRAQPVPSSANGAWLIVARALRTEPPPRELWEDPSRGRLARYTWGDDYHAVVRDRLGSLAERIRQYAGLTAPPRVFVDSTPLPEKELAARANLGFLGRNTLLISETDGSWIALGGLELPWRPKGAAPTDPGKLMERSTRGCGTCRRCCSACPTGALVEDRVLDARRCIAWATVECRGEIPLALRTRLHRWLAGCDLCQECCPWNQRSRNVQEVRAAFDAELHTPLLMTALALSPQQFHERYGHSAVARLGWTRWIRNALAAAATAPADPALRAAVHRHQDSSDPIVRATARWAVHYLDRSDEEEPCGE